MSTHPCTYLTLTISTNEGIIENVGITKTPIDNYFIQALNEYPQI